MFRNTEILPNNVLLYYYCNTPNTCLYYCNIPKPRTKITEIPGIIIIVAGCSVFLFVCLFFTKIKTGSLERKHLPNVSEWSKVPQGLNLVS